MGDLHNDHPKFHKSGTCYKSMGNFNKSQGVGIPPTSSVEGGRGDVGAIK